MDDHLVSKFIEQGMVNMVLGAQHTEGAHRDRRTGCYTFQQGGILGDTAHDKVPEETQHTRAPVSLHRISG